MTHGRIEKSKSITTSIVVGRRIFVTTERKMEKLAKPFLKLREIL